jgi:hypothetical protein
MLIELPSTLAGGKNWLQWGMGIRIPEVVFLTG